MTPQRIEAHAGRVRETCGGGEAQTPVIAIEYTGDVGAVESTDSRKVGIVAPAQDLGDKCANAHAGIMPEPRREVNTNPKCCRHALGACRHNRPRNPPEFAGGGVPLAIRIEPFDASGDE